SEKQILTIRKFSISPDPIRLSGKDITISVDAQLHEDIPEGARMKIKAWKCPAYLDGRYIFQLLAWCLWDVMLNIVSFLTRSMMTNAHLLRMEPIVVVQSKPDFQSREPCCVYAVNRWCCKVVCFGKFLGRVEIYNSKLRAAGMLFNYWRGSEIISLNIKSST
ncbi:ML domain-containing protein, partial [Trichonephila clavata]